MNALIIVESPSKARTIQRFLGAGYTVKSTMGHLVDLPVNKIGIDFQKDFTPEYEIIKGKGKIVAELKKSAKGVDICYLATDEDREGESIGWHVRNLLDLPDSKVKRIVFHEITKTAISNALKSPRSLDTNLVNAQKARRLLDRIVGYTLSPLLIKKIAKGLSAGRVQSVALRFIVEREREIETYAGREYVKVQADFSKPGVSDRVAAELFSVDGEKTAVEKKTKLFDGYFTQKSTSLVPGSADDLIARIKKAAYSVSEVKRSERKSSPPPPFNTASYAAACARRFGYNAKFSMSLAQALYEGVKIGEEYTGLITYMRTDSYNIAEQALVETREFIREKFGEAALPAAPRLYKTKSSTAQEAHECIRPVDVKMTPESVREYLTEDQYKAYSIVFSRFVASQMPDAVYSVLSFKLTGDNIVFSGSGSAVKFKGYLEMYEEDKDEDGDESEARIPDLTEGEALDLAELKDRVLKTPPPPRYNEASLIKTLEKYEIGRPSTYAPIISNLKTRTYIVVADRKFMPQKISFHLMDYLKKHFSEIVDIDFTSRMEDEMDMIAGGKTSEVKVLGDFYAWFKKDLVAAEGVPKPASVAKPTDKKCVKCGRPMMLRVSVYGEFYGCSGFPRCKYKENIKKDEPAAPPAPAAAGGPAQ